MKKTFKTIIAGAVAAYAVVGVAALSGCSASNAATVNGVAIPESDVTAYIQDFRAEQELTSDESWATWLKSNKMTPSEIRSDVIDYLVDQELYRQAAEQYGVVIETGDIEAAIESAKTTFGGEEGFQEALANAHMSEQKYIDNVVKQQVMIDKLASSVSESSDITDADILSELQAMEGSLDGAKKSSHILFAEEDKAKAEEVLAAIKAGTLSFDEAVTQYSIDTASAAEGGNVGWQGIVTFVDEYDAALDGLQTGQLSDLVKTQFGYHIIEVTDTYHVPAGGIQSLSDVPEDIVEYVGASMTGDTSDAFNEWFEGYKADADITINEQMPSGLPYDVDVEKYAVDTGVQTQSGGYDEVDFSSGTTSDNVEISIGDGSDSTTAETVNSSSSPSSSSSATNAGGASE